MHSAPRLLGVCLLVLLVAGCQGGGTADPQRLSALNGRLDALEKRVAAAEQRAGAREQPPNDSVNLDRRLSSLETIVRDLAARPEMQPTLSPPSPAPTPQAPVAPRARTTTGAPAAVPQARLERTERRAELRDLSDEFRSRAAQLRSDPGASPEAMRELLDWYHEQRRAIRHGKGRMDR